MNQPDLALCNPEPGDTALAHGPEARVTPHVLVVDDSATSCLVLGSHLEKLGCWVTTVCDGDGAVDAFLAGSPDLVLLNVMMTGTDGYEVTRRIKALAGGRFTPVIFLPRSLMRTPLRRMPKTERMIFWSSRSTWRAWAQRSRR